MSTLIKSDKIVLQKKLQGVEYDLVPGSIYHIKHNAKVNQYYLEEIEKYQLPEKIYGNREEFVKNLLNIYDIRQKNTGVQFYGQKGNGKTLLMKKIALDSNLPILILTENFFLDNDFISFITDPGFYRCVLIFDEYEKILKESGSRTENPLFLQFLDGVFKTNFLILLSSNSQHMPTYIEGRTSRILFAIDFTKPPKNIFHEILDDMLEDKSKMEEIKKIVIRFEQINIDQFIDFIKLVNIIKDQRPSEIIKIMNIQVNESNGYMQLKEGSRIIDFLIKSPNINNHINDKKDNNLINIFIKFQDHVYVDRENVIMLEKEDYSTEEYAQNGKNKGPNIIVGFLGVHDDYLIIENNWIKKPNNTGFEARVIIQGPVYFEDWAENHICTKEKRIEIRFDIPELYFI